MDLANKLVNLIFVEIVVMKRILLSLLIFCLSCGISSSKPIDNINPVNTVDIQNFDDMSRAYFASGCFWCVETIYESLEGVEEVYSGYAGGTTINPNYYQVMSGKTGHAEAIEIIYDSSKVSFDMLLKVFFDSHNPTTPNRQGPDYGTQYRSIAFFNKFKSMCVQVTMTQAPSGDRTPQSTEAWRRMESLFQKVSFSLA